MKKTLGIETDYREKNTETENLITNTPCRMSNHDGENSLSVSVTSDNVNPLMRPDLILSFSKRCIFAKKNEGIEEHTSQQTLQKTGIIRTASSVSGKGSWFDNCYFPPNPTFSNVFKICQNVDRVDWPRKKLLR